MFTTILSLGTIGLQIFCLLLIVGLVVKAPFISKIAKHSQIILISIFVGSSIASFIYQYGFGYEPCLLCWYQRIFIFGISFILLTGNILKNKIIRNQVILFSIIGLAIAIFHNYIDIFPSGLDVCGATGPSCLMRYIYEFGYITIPMMSFTALLSGLLLAITARRYPQEAVAV